MQRLGATRENIIRDASRHEYVIRGSKDTLGDVPKLCCRSTLDNWFTRSNKYPSTVRAGKMAMQWGLRRTAELEQQGYCAQYPDPAQ